MLQATTKTLFFLTIFRQNNSFHHHEEDTDLDFESKIQQLDHVLTTITRLNNMMTKVLCLLLLLTVVLLQ